MKLKISLLCLVAAILAGCATADKVFSQPVVTGTPGNYTTNWVVNPNTQAVGAAVGTLIPGYGTLAALALGMVSTGWTAWLNRKNKAGLVSTIEAVEQFRDGLRSSGSVGGSLDEKLVNGLVLAHAQAGVSTLVQSLVDKNTIKSDSKAADDVGKVLGAVTVTKQ
jgi:hypothetical protein